MRPSTSAKLTASRAGRSRLPKELVVELSQTESLGHEAWVEARKKSDFALFQPWLEKIVALKREVAERVGYEGAMYNALLDEYEPYARAEEIAPVFAQLKAQLVPLVEQIAATGQYPARGVLDQEYPIEQQELLGRQVLADMGFDMQAGTARLGGASVLLGHVPRRCAADDSLQRRLAARRALWHHPRGRARTVRTGPARRRQRHPGRREHFARDPRVAIAAVGEHGRPQQRPFGLITCPSYERFFPSSSARLI